MNGKEAGIGAGVSNAWNERMRLIRLRRRKERWNFREELRVIPRWLIVTLILLFVIVQIVAGLINFYGAANGVAWPGGPQSISPLALAGIITLCAVFLVPWILLLGYVNRDAKRRGMNSALWTLLCIMLMPAYLALGFIIYFLVREPLPYVCPKCGATVGPRFNFCPTCRCDLHPSCPSCKREVVENDKFCPFCGHDLAATVAPPPVS